MENPGHLLQRIELIRTTLWLHYFNRTLYSFDLESREFHRENPPFSSALDDFFLLPDGRVLAAMEKGDIWVNTSGNWEFLTEIPFSGLSKSNTRTPPPRVTTPGLGRIPLYEMTYRMTISEEEIVVLSPFNLYRFSLDSGEWTVVPLGEWLFDAIQVSISTGPKNSLYAGFNRGELPGGLKMIDGDSGSVVTIDGRQPVTGIVPDPCRNGDLVVSAGCCHRTLDFGGLYCVSGSKIEPLFLESAIYDLKSSGNGVLAAGKGLFFYYDGKKIQSCHPGKFSVTNGLTCSDLTKKSFQVCTDINTRASWPAFTPLIAVRSD
jgi:hypothetical protein